MTYAKRLPALIATALFAFGSATTAQQSDASANAWFLGCKALAEGRANNTLNLKMGNFCSGVVHGLGYVGEILPPEMQFCTPKNSTATQFARVVVQYIEAQPQRMHEDFRDL